MSYLKVVVEYAKRNYKEEYDKVIKPMADYSLQLAQIVGADPITCIISSLLHKLADNTKGEFRSNKVNALLREFGFKSELIDAVNNCVINFIPIHQKNQESLECPEKCYAFCEANNSKRWKKESSTIEFSQRHIWPGS